MAANGGHTEAEITAEDGGEGAVPTVQGNFKDGVYEGTGKGNNGDITVEVTVEGGNIVSVVLKEHGETEGIYEAAEKGVVEEMIAGQTADVDTVSGATNTSKGIIEAVTAALEGAKKNRDKKTNVEAESRTSKVSKTEGELHFIAVFQQIIKICRKNVKIIAILLQA